MYGSSWVRLLSGTQIFTLSHVCEKLNIPSFLFLSEFEKYHVCFFINKISVHTKVEIKTTEDYMQQLHFFIFIVLLIF